MPEYAVGPGHHIPHRGAVAEAYAETDALNRRCPNCNADAGEFCHHPGGNERKIPCPKRLKGGSL